jgi:hypothetical protein
LAETAAILPQFPGAEFKKKWALPLKLRKSFFREEKMSLIGYELLRQSLHLTAFSPDRPALVKPVTRIKPTDAFLAVPRHVAPDTDDPDRMF